MQQSGPGSGHWMYDHMGADILPSSVFNSDGELSHLQSPKQSFYQWHRNYGGNRGWWLSKNFCPPVSTQMAKKLMVQRRINMQPGDTQTAYLCYAYVMLVYDLQCYSAFSSKPALVALLLHHLCTDVKKRLVIVQCYAPMITPTLFSDRGWVYKFSMILVLFSGCSTFSF